MISRFVLRLISNQEGRMESMTDAVVGQHLDFVEQVVALLHQIPLRIFV